MNIKMPRRRNASNRDHKEVSSHESFSITGKWLSNKLASKKILQVLLLTLKTPVKQQDTKKLYMSIFVTGQEGHK